MTPPPGVRPCAPQVLYNREPLPLTSLCGSPECDLQLFRWVRVRPAPGALGGQGGRALQSAREGWSQAWSACGGHLVH